MKLVIDEKLKHRLVGVSVILSLGAIFLPAMMKKSGQRLENNFSVNVQLPPKPVAPNVAVTDEDAMFKTIKISRTDHAPVSAGEQKNTSFDREDYIESIKTTEVAAVSVVKSEPLPDADALAKPIELALSNATPNAAKKQARIAIKSPGSHKIAQKKSFAKVKNATPARKEVYAVQLASFANQANALALVNKLRNKGYKANYAKVVSQKGVVYKVYTGHSPVKNDVIRLRTKLASAMQLKGFVVNTGVS